MKFPEAPAFLRFARWHRIKIGKRGRALKHDIHEAVVVPERFGGGYQHVHGKNGSLDGLTEELRLKGIIGEKQSVVSIISDMVLPDYPGDELGRVVKIRTDEPITGEQPYHRPILSRNRRNHGNDGGGSHIISW